MLLTVSITNVIAQSKVDAVQAPSYPKTEVTDSLTYTIVTVDNYKFGYCIFKNRSLLIRQLHIPGAQGQEGFETRDDAARVARLVISKIKKETFPPSITSEELQNMKIKFR